jgi:dTDP-N-acetylfucosamine:lipid II N-acetylfucosaminyltransferase
MPVAKRIKILHIFNDPKFSKGFFEFLGKNNIPLDEHFLFHYRCTRSTCSNYGMRSIFASNFFSIIPNLLLFFPLIRAEKIVIHSLASPFLLFYLSIFPSIAHKSYWVIWGKDLYFYKSIEKPRIHHKIYEIFRKIAIKKIRHIITYNRGDYELAKKWYGCNAILHRCFMYPSNLYNDLGYSNKRDGATVILVGNSADPSNNHLDSFSLLEKFSDQNIEIISPLSYGNKKYAKKVIESGRKIFGDKFVPLENFLPLDSYIDLLKNVDIAVFSHRRQQAMGNITTLLGMGKKVYIRDDIVTWKYFEDLGVQVCNLNNFSLDEISPS